MVQKNNVLLNYSTPQLHQTHNHPNFQPKKKNGISFLEFLFWSGLSILAIREVVKYYNKKEWEEYLKDLCKKKGIDCKYLKNISSFKSIADVEKHLKKSSNKIASNSSNTYSGKSGTLETNQSRYSKDSTTYPILVGYKEKSERRFAGLEDFTKKSLDKSCMSNECDVRNKRGGSAGKMTTRNNLSAIYINAES